MATFIFIGSLMVSILLSSYSNGSIGKALSPGAVGNPVPGIVFGICLLLIFTFTLASKQKIWKNLIFLFISSTAYFAAVWAAIYSSGWVKGDCGSWSICDNQLRLGFSIAGVIGGFILSAVGLKLLLKFISWPQVFILTVLSGILGFCAVYVLSAFNLFTELFPIFGLYLVWQTGMAIAIFVSIKKYQNKLINQANVRIPSKSNY